MLPDNTARSLGAVLPAFLGRLALGWFFVLAGWGKVVNEVNNGVGSFYRGSGFQDRNPAWLPEVIAAPYGYALPWAELIGGALLLLGLFTRISAGLVAFILFTIGIALLDAGDLLPRHHVLVFFPLALLLWQAGADRLTIDYLIRRRRGV